MPKVTFDEGFSTEHLEGESLKVANVILAGIRKFYQQAAEDTHLESGGCRMFHEKNKLGWGSSRGVLLTVVHEGTDVDHFFSLDACFNGRIGFSTYEFMQNHIAKEGFFAEQYNSCVTKVYKS